MQCGCATIGCLVALVQEDAVDLLLKWGADPDLRDNDGICARQLARSKVKDAVRMRMC